MYVWGTRPSSLQGFYAAEKGGGEHDGAEVEVTISVAPRMYAGEHLPALLGGFLRKADRGGAPAHLLRVCRDGYARFYLFVLVDAPDDGVATAGFG